MDRVSVAGKLSTRSFGTQLMSVPRDSQRPAGGLLSFMWTRQGSQADGDVVPPYRGWISQYATCVMIVHQVHSGILDQGKSWRMGEAHTTPMTARHGQTTANQLISGAGDATVDRILSLESRRCAN